MPVTRYRKQACTHPPGMLVNAAACHRESSLSPQEAQDMAIFLSWIKENK